MDQGKRPTVIAGNWKMYKTIEEALQFVDQLAGEINSTSPSVYLAVPYTAIKPIADQAQETKIVVGAQNMNDANEGAFTGEIAGRMLKNAGAKFVILGHSERRHLFNESDAFINRKVKRALEDGLKTILCVGETLQEREQGNTEQVLEAQLTKSLAEITPKQLKGMILAYEPVWAIGTGLTASPEQAEEMHKFCREVIAKTWGDDVADQIAILYGGSVNPKNVHDLMQQTDIDGVLVGGASLDPDSFLQIINYQTINV